MPALLYSTCVWFLVLLMIGTSPFGMGVGVHRDQLLDPVFPHVHLRDGRIVPISTVTSGAEGNQPVIDDQLGFRGPAIGAGTAGMFDGIGADAPALPVDASAKLLVSARGLWATPAQGSALPRGLEFAPPDPPPTLSV